MENIKPEPGDLVRFVKSPIVSLPHIIPHNKKPLGLVISIENKRELGVLGVIAKVLWSIASWNGSSGVSEEMTCDLCIVQKARDFN